MNRVVIVHCWEGSPTYCWYPQVKKALEEKGIAVSVPLLPETEMPKLSLWLPLLKEVSGEPNEDLFLVGHSIGCAAILRFLESYPEGVGIGGVVLVAGFTDNLGFAEIQNFFEKPFDFGKIRHAGKKFTAIYSDNDPFVPLAHADILKEKLGAKIIVKERMNHFSGEVDNEDSCTSLPDVVEELMELMNT